MPSTTVSYDSTAITRVLRRFGWLIALLAILGGVVGAQLATNVNQGYVATADLQLARDPSDQSGNAQTAARFAANELAELTSPQAVAESVADAGGNVTISWEALDSSDVVRLQAVGSSADAAEGALDSMMTRYLDERSDEIQQQVDTARELLGGQLAEVSDTLDNASPESERALLAERTELRLRLAALDTTQAFATAKPRLVSDVSGSANSRGVATFVLLGAILGGLVGLVITIVYDRFAAKVRGSHDGIVDGVPERGVELRAGGWHDQTSATQSTLIGALTGLQADANDDKKAGIVLVPVDGGADAAHVADLLDAAYQQCASDADHGDTGRDPLRIVLAESPDSPEVAIGGSAGMSAVMLLRVGKTRIRKAREVCRHLDDNRSEVGLILALTGVLSGGPATIAPQPTLTSGEPRAVAESVD